MRFQSHQIESSLRFVVRLSHPSERVWSLDKLIIYVCQTLSCFIFVQSNSPINLQRTIRKWLFSVDLRMLTLDLPNGVTLSCDIVPTHINPHRLSAASQSGLVFEPAKLSCIDGAMEPVHLKAVKIFRAGEWGTMSKLETCSTESLNKSKHHSSLQFPTIFQTFKFYLIPSSDQICESVLFGSGRVLLPATHWSIDWDELEQIQQRFSALCKSLCEKVKNGLKIEEFNQNFS